MNALAGETYQQKTVSCLELISEIKGSTHEVVDRVFLGLYRRLVEEYGPDGSPSPHYADQLALYAQWRRKPMWHGGETVGEHASVRVTLIYQP